MSVNLMENKVPAKPKLIGKSQGWQVNRSGKAANGEW
jgi:hypothetical protein